MGYEPVGDFEIPESDQATIWRYLSFPSLVSLLQRESLHFSRVDSFDDDYEGFIPKNLLKVLVKRANEHNRNIDQAYDWGDEIDPGANPMEPNPYDQFKIKRICSYANCWNLRGSESFALWEANLGATDGVVVKSSVGNLKSSLRTNEAVHLSKIEYVDYEEADKYHFDRSIEHPYLYKRNALEYEQELRALIVEQPPEWVLNNPSEYDWSEQDPWKRVRVDLSTLMDEIRVSPRGGGWQKQLIEDELLQGQNLNVTMSNLSISRDEFYDDIELYESEFGLDEQ